MPNRIKTVFVCLILVFCAITGKLFYWQIIKRKDLLILASNQQTYFQEISSSRGNILSSDKSFLVMNQENFLVYADPSRLKISPNDLENKLKRFIPQIKVDYFGLSDKKKYWSVIEENVNEETRRLIEKESIYGINFKSKTVRFYPEASMSAHLLGFLGKDEKGEQLGYFGLEGYYNKELFGKPGRIFYEKDAAGGILPLGEVREEKQVEGRDLILNLDRFVQFTTERLLKEGIEKYDALSGSVLIMNPKNGAVIAMASFPGYDPAVYFDYDLEVFRNPVVSSLFEPGSIIKVLEMAAAIDAGAVSENDLCQSCSGPLNIGEYSIKTWNEKYYPNSSMTDIIVHSDNVGMVYVVRRLGLKKLLSYLENFGFGEETGVDLEGEITSSLRPQQDWSDIDLATVSFGQGIAVTRLQMLSAVSAIANGGTIFQPQVVDKIVDRGKEIDIKPVRVRKVVSKQTADIVTKMMVSAVENGEAKWAKPDGYQIAGKTGTAQIPISGHYDKEKTIASFIGFAPAKDPLFAMLVTLGEPKTSPWGSETAAPLWFSIAKEIFRLWEVKPSQ